jgi:hypothetical protein
VRASDSHEKCQLIYAASVIEIPFKNSAVRNACVKVMVGLDFRRVCDPVNPHSLKNWLDILNGSVENIST